MGDVIDARGRPCPQPVLMTKAALDEGRTAFAVLVDNEGSAQNVSRFAANAGCQASIVPEDGVFRVEVSRNGGGSTPVHTGDVPITCNVPAARTRTLVIQTESLGQGSEELGRRLITQFLSTLAANETVPERVVLLNGGVKLACQGSESMAALRDLAARGVEILACGTCLNHFDLNGQLTVGRPTNAYEVLNLLLQGDVVTWG
ncbi:MAG: sulfurtransferase-like selenium metabolism protein YedF [Bacillota bacterium]|nr:sulfurtransferase-like selenium metabolism protein YedF [Bacillota bacterium]